MVRVVLTFVFALMLSVTSVIGSASAKNWNTGNNSQTASNQTKTLAMSKKVNESTSRFIRDKYSCIIGKDQSQRPKEADNRELQDINFAFAYLDNDNFLDLIQGYDKEPKNEFNITEPLDYKVFLSSKKKFAPAVKTLLARKILVQDFNGDGKDDVFFLAAGNHAPPRKGFPNTILLSVKDGHEYKRVDGGSRISHGGGAGDLDKDGDIDVVVANGQQKTVQLLTNKGDGTFKATSLINEWQHGKKDHFYTAEVWDIDEDGFLDVVLGTPEVGLVFLWGLPSSKDSPKFSSKQRFSPPILKDRLPLDMAFADFDGDGHDEMAIIDTRIFDKRYRGWGITLVNFDGKRKPTIKSLYDDDPQQNFHWHGWIDACDVDDDRDIDLSAQMIGNNDLRKYPNVGKIEWINQGANWSQKIINRDELLSQQKRSSTSMTNKGANHNAATLTPQPSVETPDGTTPSKELCKGALLPFQKVVPEDQFDRSDVRTGEAGELLVVAKLLKMGVKASTFAQGDAFDLCAELDGSLLRLQVKTVSKLKSSYSFNFHRGYHYSPKGIFPYTSKDFDISACVNLYDEKVIFFPGVKKSVSFKRQQFLQKDVEQETWIASCKELHKCLAQ